MSFIKNKNSSFNYKAARQFLKDREQKRIRHNKVLYKKANSDCKKIIEMIIEKYRPKRIYQWGSLLNSEQFSEISDIDIAVEGVGSAEKFFALYGEAMKMTDIKLDLIEMEKIEPVYRDSIVNRGKMIYERRK